MASTFANATLLIVLLMASGASAQNTSPAPAGQNSASAATVSSPVDVPMPKDPAAILDVAAKLNGLSGPDVRPWHIKLSYQTFDQGKAQESGVYEEFWVSDKKYKRSYTSSSFTQTDFATENGLYRSGNQNWPGYLETMIRNLLIEPVPAVLDLRGFRLQNTRRTIEKANFQCVTLKADWIFFITNGYCFEADHPILRSTISAGDRNGALYNHILAFQGRFVARDVSVTNAGRPRLVIHVEALEGLTATNEAAFVPPADAVRVADSKITIPWLTMHALLLRQVPPHYPESAKISRVEGKVSLQITVGKTGDVTNAQAISGPNELRKEAVDAVRKWEFRPLVVAGQPVEVETETELIFTLGS